MSTSPSPMAETRLGRLEQHPGGKIIRLDTRSEFYNPRAPCRLLALPHEIRTLIWRFTVLESHLRWPQLVQGWRKAPSATHSGFQNVPTRTGLNLILANRQIYHEATAVFYNNNTLWFKTCCEVESLLDREVVPLRSLELIRHISYAPFIARERISPSMTRSHIAALSACTSLKTLELPMHAFTDPSIEWTSAEGEGWQEVFRIIRRNAGSLTISSCCDYGFWDTSQYRNELMLEVSVLIKDLTSFNILETRGWLSTALTRATIQLRIQDHPVHSLPIAWNGNDVNVEIWGVPYSVELKERNRESRRKAAEDLRRIQLQGSRGGKKLRRRSAAHGSADEDSKEDSEEKFTAQQLRNLKKREGRRLPKLFVNGPKWTRKGMSDELP